MRRRAVEPFLKTIDRRFRVLRYSNRGQHIFHGGNDAVYYGGRYVCVVPVGNIYVHGNENYRGTKYRNRSLRGLFGQIMANTPVLSHKIKGAEHAIYANN